MANLPSTQFYIQTEATRFRSAVAESVAQQIGSAINWLNDQFPGILASITALQNQAFTKFTDLLVVGGTTVTLGTVSTDGSQSVQCHGFCNSTFSTGPGLSIRTVATPGSSSIAILRNGTPIFSFANSSSGAIVLTAGSIFHDVPPAGTWTYELVVSGSTWDGVFGRVSLTRLKVGL